MFSSMKVEEYMESELSGIFRVKLFARYNQAVSTIWCLFLEKHTNILNRTVGIYCFPY